MSVISPETNRLVGRTECASSAIDVLLRDAPVLKDASTDLAPADPPPPTAPEPPPAPTACISSCKVGRKNVGPPTGARDGPIAALQLHGKSE